MKVREIVKDFLEKNKSDYDGLVNSMEACGCETADLMPCESEDIYGCAAAHKISCGGEETVGGVLSGNDWCEGDCEWHMMVGKRSGYAKRRGQR